MTNYMALYVPVTGPLRLHQGDAPLDVPALLREEVPNPGRFVDFGIKDGDSEMGRVGFIVTSPVLASVNERARDILVWLSGAHLVVTGPAAFTGLTDEQVVHILREWT